MAIRSPEELPLLHDTTSDHEAKLKKIEKRRFIKSIIYGGMDGVISVFVTLASVSGSHEALGVGLILALATLTAGGVSMGIGDWLSTQAHVQHARSERRREEWEVEHYLEGEKQEMIDIYVKKGIPEEKAHRIVDILSRNERLFVDIMMVEELGILPEDEKDTPWKHGLANFFAYLLFGAVPLVVYVSYSVLHKVFGESSLENTMPFLVSFASAALTLFFMGIFEAKYTHSGVWWKSSLSIMTCGSFAAFAGFGIAWLLEKAFPDAANVSAG